MNTSTKVTTAANLSLLAGLALATVVGGLNAPGEQVSGLWGPGSEVVQAQRAQHPVNAPSAETFTGTLPEGCVAALPAGVVPAALAVVRLDGSVVEMLFDEAIERGQNKNHADDVWVVGSCE